VAEVRLAYIVEGHGEIESVPRLVRRIAARLDPTLQIRDAEPIRLAKGRMLRSTDFEGAVERAARTIGSRGGLLVVLDGDDDCPAQLGPRLLARAVRQRSDVRIGVVVAQREFEAWFLAGAHSLRGFRGLAAELVAPPDPESVRDAKGWLSARMAGDLHYVPTVDQKALVARFDLDQARRASSFDKCYREITRLLTADRA
jgi:hypothetical protein